MAGARRCAPDTIGQSDTLSGQSERYRIAPQGNGHTFSETEGQLLSAQYSPRFKHIRTKHQMQTA